MDLENAVIRDRSKSFPSVYPEPVINWPVQPIVPQEVWDMQREFNRITAMTLDILGYNVPPKPDDEELSLCVGEMK